MGLRVYLADDHPVVLAGARALLQTEGDVQVAGEAEDGAALLAMLERDPDCDVLVTDFSMPQPHRRDCDGMPLLHTLRRKYPALRIVVLTMIENPALLHAMLEAGIHGLVDKASSLHELLQAIRSVAVGRRYIGSGLRPLLERPSPGRLPHLSPHEAEVLRLFAEGMRVTEIAARLSRSVKTVSRQKNDAMRKLGVENHSQLYAYARDHGLAS